jgi:hypothetical protein
MRRAGAGGTGTGPDLAEIRRSEQAETGAWDEVQAAVLARSAGRSRAEMRQMLIAELQSLNRPVPDDRILDLRVEQVTFAPQPLPLDASAFTVLKALAGMVRQGRAVDKKLAAMRGEVHRLEGRGGSLLTWWRRTTRCRWPMSSSGRVPRPSWIVVSLERDPAGGDPVPVVVYSREDLVSRRSARRVGR